MGIAEELSGVPGWKIEKLAELLSDPSKNVVFIYNADSMLDKSPGDLHAIAGILLLTGRIGKAKNGLLLARQYSNSQGYHDLLGDLPLKELKEALQSGRIKGFFLLGEDLAGDETLAKQLSNAEFVVAMDLLETGTTNLADVVLPGSAFAESEGSITSFDRKVQTFNRAFEPLAGMTGWEIMTWLVAGASGSKAYTLDEVRRQIAALNPRYHRLIKLGNQGMFHWNETSDGGELLFASNFLTPDGKAHMNALPQAMSSYPWKEYEGSSIEYFYEEKVEALL
jgi:formate dehydrogenase major subunit